MCYNAPHLVYRKKIMADNIRVRFAPSPTGSLHIGGARTALYNYLFAKKNQGTFIVRIEDTDVERSTHESMQTILADLKWLGLSWQEGVTADTLAEVGKHGPYKQSERKSIYQSYADTLLAEGKAYYCFLTDEEMDAQRMIAKAEKRPYQIISPYRDLSLDEAKTKLNNGELATVRFKTPLTKQDYSIDDMVRGEVTFPSNMVGDFVILRSDGMPVYNFCCVVDDALMQISHVFRGEEHLPNTLRQLMLYEGLGFKAPEFAHLSIILGESRKKLSKRDQGVSCIDFRQKGYLPEALNNYIALLGWSDPEGREILTLDEMCAAFSVDHLNAAAPIFDLKKLNWVNAQHIRMLDKKVLWDALQPYFREAGLILPDNFSWQNKAISLFTPELETLQDAVALFTPLSDNQFQLNDEAKELLSWESTPTVIARWIHFLHEIDQDYLSEEDFAHAIEDIKTHCAVKGKFLFMPIRVAIIGKPHGAELKLLVPLLKCAELNARAEACLEKVR